MKKKGTSSIFTLWEKAAKEKKNSTSTPNPPPVEIENNLQVALAKESGDCTWFFGQLAILLNVLGNSCKRMRMLRMAQAKELIDALELEEVETERGLNQEMGLGRPCDTR